MSYILDNTSEKFNNVSSFRTMHMKATDEQILIAVDCEMCENQTKKLHIIHLPLDDLKLCKHSTLNHIYSYNY